ncbi:UDP-glucoronosyl and UDP-glucosyl transferase [Haloferula helveola]|uniref:UDP-glucoronosyl and UDP-glucosyl transferase n=1 Tax=Haloferula helveola TaxID=490095 RepID=A0ABN6GZE8_9BACT|nr:UDP-glucoronosyl and UDP-glucosyl transferase [Haloferula helveola]
MRFLISTLGSFGDVAPFISIALGLKERGHEVLFVVNPYHRKVLEKWGLEMVPAGDAEAMESRFRDPRVNHLLHVIDYLSEAATAELREHYDAIAANITPDTVIVYRGTMLAPRLVEEKFGNPACGVYLTAIELSGVEDRPQGLGHIFNPVMRHMPARLFSFAEKVYFKRFIDRPLLPAVNGLRQEIGLPKVEGHIRNWLMGTRMTIGLYPEWYGFGGKHLTPSFRNTGFAFLPTDETTPLDPALEAFLADGPPPVVISRGSALRYADDLVERIQSACRELGQRSLLLSFDHQGPPEVDGDHCVSAPVSIGRVLPRCKALVHRGGVGAMADALRFGIPQLILGQSIDHPDNGERVTRLSAGRWLFTLTTTYRMMVRALDAVVNDPAIAAGAREISDRFDVDGWMEETLDLIESIGPGEVSGKTQPVSRSA